MIAKPPTKKGQICEKIDSDTEQKSEDVFIVVDDPTLFTDDDKITVVSLNDLQRNIANPDLTNKTLVTKKNLNLIAEDLSSYIESWNSK